MYPDWSYIRKVEVLKFTTQHEHKWCLSQQASPTDNYRVLWSYLVSFSR